MEAVYNTSISARCLELLETAVITIPTVESTLSQHVVPVTAHTHSHHACLSFVRAGLCPSASACPTNRTNHMTYPVRSSAAVHQFTCTSESAWIEYDLALPGRPQVVVPAGSVARSTRARGAQLLLRSSDLAVHILIGLGSGHAVCVLKPGATVEVSAAVPLSYCSCFLCLSPHVVRRDEPLAR